ncbi:MAG: WXG100 family type VII secretion target [Clostridiales Family XIII bacterium]|jgi:WXG100 family type VII secretion target|nr:WXG100 family type VII secretion target [Clostridiales Family XIII bacterium]
MAGSNMTLDYAAMRDVGNKILQEQQTLQDFVNRMQSDINELIGVWESAASREFENTWNQVKPSLDRLYNELIPNIKAQIHTAADNYEAADNAAAQAARGI